MSTFRAWFVVGALSLGAALSYARANNSIPASVRVTPSERAARLEAQLQQTLVPQERVQIRYVLGNVLQDLGDTTRALQIFSGLEKDYPLLKERILTKEAQLSGDSRKWQDVAQQNGPLRPEALYQLGRSGDQSSFQQLISQYPDHPRTAAILSQWLDQAPNNPVYLRQWVTYFADQPASVRYAKTFETTPGLSSSDWQLLGKLYFQNKEYQRALLALSRSNLTADDLLMMGKTYQALKQTDPAQAVLDRLAQNYPQSPAAAQGQLLKASLLPKEQRVAFYQQVAQTFPAVGGTALWQAALINPNPSLYQQILKNFPQSNEAVMAAWEVAWRASQGGDTQPGRILGQRALAEFKSDKYVTPRLGFWAGRWTEQAGDRQGAQALFKQVIRRFPASYYAWRSAVHLGLDRDAFNARTLPVAVQIDDIPPQSLPGGSPVVRELFRLGLPQDALAEFQAENYQLPELTPVLQATAAILRQQTTGQSLPTLKQLLPLAFEDNAKVPELQQSRGFWEAAYPAPYWSELAAWSNQQQVNPLLALSLMRQESAFEPGIKSRAGALGLMQIMPATAQHIASKIGIGSYTLTKPSDNIRLGTWYLAHTHDLWQNNSLLAVASYNAGPGNVSRWAKTLPLNDPELFVEQIPFRETKGYVKSVFGNYWNYLRLYSSEYRERLQGI